MRRNVKRRSAIGEGHKHPHHLRDKIYNTFVPLSIAIYFVPLSVAATATESRRRRQKKQQPSPTPCASLSLPFSPSLPPSSYPIHFCSSPPPPPSSFLLLLLFLYIFYRNNVLLSSNNFVYIIIKKMLSALNYSMNQFMTRLERKKNQRFVGPRP